MPRMGRILSASGIYHVMFRGNERKNVFQDEQDKVRFIDTLIAKKNEVKFNLYAYCVMDNHVHLLIKEGAEPLATTMKRIGTSYAVYYNFKHDRVGHVFQSRFKSENIESDSHLLEVLRYIHNNPVKANIVKNASKYIWSSYQFYKNKDRYFGDSLFEGITKDAEFILGIFSENPGRAVVLFDDYLKQRTEEQYMDMEEVNKEECIRNIIERLLKDNHIDLEELKGNKTIRDDIIGKLKQNYQMPGRRISRALGIGRNVVQRVR